MTKKMLMLAGTALILAHYPGRAYAEDAEANAKQPEYSSDIVVEARKRSERLIKIPETIAALTADTIKNAGISSLEDVGRQTPNIVLNRRQDNEPNVVIRGVGAFGNTQGIGFYIDDVQNFTDQSASIEDVERIEILKGPQGTLYGGSNVGGAIKYILKKPATGAFHAEGKAEYGSFGTANVFAAANLPASDTLAARVSGYYNHTDGYVRNTLIGGRPDESDEWGVRLALGWQPMAGMDVQFSYRHNELENGGNIYAVGSTGADYHRTVDYNNDVFNKRIVDGGILKLTYDAGFADVTSVTSYSHRTNRFRWDLDYSAADGVVLYNGKRHSTDVVTQELRLASNGGGPFDWLVGGYYASIDNRNLTNDADLYFGVDAGGPAFIPDYNNGDTMERQYAVFGTANYDFGGFRVGGGLRVARAEFNGRDFNIPLSTDVNETIVLPKLTLAYDINANTMLYANFAIGSEPGKVNVISGTGGAYRSERATSYEAGIKGTTFGRTLTYELAGFYIDYKRRQFESRFVGSSGAIVEETTNIGRSVSYGVEGSIVYRPVPELTVSLSGGYLHSEWDDRNALYYLAPINGLTVPNSPEFSGNAAIEYRQPLDNGLELGLRGDVTHTSSFFWDVPNASWQPAYEIVNLRVSLGDPDAGWEVSVRGENVFSAKYYTEYTPDVFGPGIGLGAPGAPGRVMGSVNFKF